jgi:hypothetical protein
MTASRSLAFNQQRVVWGKKLGRRASPPIDLSCLMMRSTGQRRRSRRNRSALVIALNATVVTSTT